MSGQLLYIIIVDLRTHGVRKLLVMILEPHQDASMHFCCIICLAMPRTCKHFCFLQHIATNYHAMQMEEQRSKGRMMILELHQDASMRFHRIPCSATCKHCCSLQHNGAAKCPAMERSKTLMTYCTSGVMMNEMKSTDRWSLVSHFPPHPCCGGAFPFCSSCRRLPFVQVGQWALQTLHLA